MSLDPLARQVAHILHALHIFHAPGAVVELRALGVQGRRAVCFVHGDKAALARRAAELDGLGASGCYFTLNPLRPDLAGATASCRKADVLERHWLPIDIDPCRPAGVSSTEVELAAAWNVHQRCRGLLDGAGLRSAAVGLSGNGWHLCYPVLFPNNDPSQEAIKHALQGLQARCGDTLTDPETAQLKAAMGTSLEAPKAKIDCATHDAPRIWKLYGTRARKGDHTPERPHRWSRLIEGEPWQRETAEANAAVLLALLERWRFAEDTRRGRPQTSAATYGAAALQQELAVIAAAAVGDRNNAANRSAFALGQLVAGGVLSGPLVAAALLAACLAAGLGEAECQATVKSGMEAGALQPRGVPEAGPKARSGLPPLPPSPPDGERIIQRASEVEPVEVCWLWPGRIPLAKLTTFAGQTSQGKTFVACDIAARVTRSETWPDGKPAPLPPGQVLYITGDDDVDDTLVPRMMEAGAVLERVVFLTEPAQAAWTMAALSTLDTALDQAGDGVHLVVVDPPTSFLHGIDDHKNAELRSILTPFKTWAKLRGVAVVLITHVNKGGGAQVEAMLRVMGSVAWVTGVRAAYLFAGDPDNSERQLFLTLKNNLGPKARALAYRLVDGTRSGRVEWLGEVDVTADEAMNKPRGKGPSRGVAASEWLVERFREQLEWESEALLALARGEGISRSAIFEAKRILDLPKARKTSQAGASFWIWWVPPDWPKLVLPGNGEPVEPLELNQFGD